MKIKTGIIILVAVCAGLLIALIATKKQSNDQHSKDASTILQFSNDLDTANIDLNDLRQVNLMLTNDLSSTRQALEAASNNLAETSSQLAGAKTEIESDQNQITNLNGRISDLEEQNKVLDDRATMLSNNIALLDDQIAATQQQLATAQTNNTFLAAELQKQMAQKAELERKFNDIDDVRAQVKKLRDQLFEARRLEWMNAGTSPATPPKGGELLMRRSLPSGSPPVAAKPSSSRPATPYDLNVEVGSDGSVHVIPATPTPQDTAAQAAARAALLKQMGGTNAPSDAGH